MPSGIGDEFRQARCRCSSHRPSDGSPRPRSRRQSTGGAATAESAARPATPPNAISTGHDRRGGYIPEHPEQEQDQKPDTCERKNRPQCSSAPIFHRRDNGIEGAELLLVDQSEDQHGRQDTKRASGHEPQWGTANRTDRMAKTGNKRTLSRRNSIPAPRISPESAAGRNGAAFVIHCVEKQRKTQHNGPDRHHNAASRRRRIRA